MGVYIPNMEKPKNCMVCDFGVFNGTRTWTWCELIGIKVDGIKHTPNDCPLIEIPIPHGRLIDGDLFKDIIKDSVPAYGIGVKIPTYGDMDVMDKIAIMPTIIEAEE